MSCALCVLCLTHNKSLFVQNTFIQILNQNTFIHVFFWKYSNDIMYANKLYEKNNNPNEFIFLDIRILQREIGTNSSKLCTRFVMIIYLEIIFFVYCDSFNLIIKCVSEKKMCHITFHIF